MTDIVFISFQFPPVIFGGVFRPLKFAKYLPDYGIRPHIYTLDPEYYHTVYKGEKIDYKLLDELKGKDVLIRHIPMDSVLDKYKNKISRFLMIYFNIYRSNEYRYWRNYLLDKIAEDAKTVKFKAVLVTAPPFSMLKLAEEVAKKLNVPLIFDMRDAWSLWLNVPYGSIAHYAITRQTERKHFSFANKIVATTDQTIADWRELHPDIPAKKYACISNGYDDEKNLINLHSFSISPLTGDSKFTIAYVGSFYYSPKVRELMIKPFYKRKGMEILHYFPKKQDWLYRTPYFFFKTLKAAFQKDPSLKNKIHIRFAGQKEQWLSEMIKEFSLEDNVELLGLVSHAESLQLQKDADALLITSAKLVGGKDCFVAGKTFEYLTMNKPILGFVAEGAQKDLLQRAGNTVFFDPDNTEEAAMNFIDLVKNGKSFNPDLDYIRSFERKKLTEKLSEVIYQTINEQS